MLQKNGIQIEAGAKKSALSFEFYDILHVIENVQNLCFGKLNCFVATPKHWECLPLAGLGLEWNSSFLLFDSH